MQGEGLNLAGGGFNLSKLAKSAGKLADVGLAVGDAAGYDVSKATGVKKALDGGAGSTMVGGAFGIKKTTLKKIKKTAAKTGRVMHNLAQEFGDAEQKQAATKAKKAVEIISGSGAKPLPGAKLREMIRKGRAHY